MYPTLLSIDALNLHFHAYAIFLSVGFLTAVFLIVRHNYKLEHPAPITPMGGLLVFLGGFIGARLYFILQYGDPAQFYQALYVWQGGLVFYGGAIGGFVGGLIYVLWVGAPVVKVGDLAMSYVPLAHAIARLGCFFNGCCYGAPSNVPWAMQFPKASMPYRAHETSGLLGPDAAASLPVHPAQLYATGGLLVVFAILQVLVRRPHPPGGVMLAYLFCYGTHRLIVESFRGDGTRYLLNMTVSQWVAVGMIATAVVIAGALRATIWASDGPESGKSAAESA